MICPKLKLFKKGKVREVYDFNDKLLIVATDNISAFDEVLPDVIIGKGRLLTKISEFWFKKFKDIRNHMISTNFDDFPKECLEYKDLLEGRSMLVWKTKPLPIESIVRGYITGSGYLDYLRTGEVCGVKLPRNIKKDSRLKKPIFTPSIKNDTGHDENISEDELLKIYHPALVNKIKEISLKLYEQALKYTLPLNIIIADTKFEFALLDGELILIDEILTPDSSRYWNELKYYENYEYHKSQESYDKQIIRDYLSYMKNGNKRQLPKYILNKTLEKYQELYDKLIYDT